MENLLILGFTTFQNYSFFFQNYKECVNKSVYKQHIYKYSQP